MNSVTLRPATADETADLKRVVRKMILDTRRFSVKRIGGSRGATVDIKRYVAFTPEEGIEIATYLRDNGWLSPYAPADQWDRFLAEPHHKGSFGNLMKIA